MNEMERLLREFEQKVLKIHGTRMQNKMLNQGEASYSVKYEFGVDNNIGTLYIIATSRNALCVSLFYGSALDERKEIYSTPYICDFAAAQKMLQKIDAIINDSAYEAYCSDIELITDTIQNVICSI